MAESSAKLVLMGSRNYRVWAIAAGIAFGLLLVCACQPDFVVRESAGGISAPLAPAPSIEAALAAKLLQSQFNGHLHALRSTSLSPSLIAVWAPEGLRQNPDSPQPFCDPLHPRPPPSFS